MTLFAIAFALAMLALWGAAVAGLWVATGALGGLGFAGLTLALAWAFWGANGPTSKIVGWNGRQPIFEQESTEPDPEE